MWSEAEQPLSWIKGQVFTQEDTIFAVSLGGGPVGADKLLVAGASKVGQLFDVATGSELATQKCDDRVRTAVLGRGGEVMATGGFDMTVRVSDVHSGARMQAFPSSDPVRSVAMDADGRIMAIGGNNKGKILVVKMETQNVNDLISPYTHVITYIFCTLRSVLTCIYDLRT